VLRLVVASIVLLIALVLQWWFDRTLVDTASDLLRGLDTLPAWLVSATVALTWALAVVMIVGGLVVALVGRRWRALLAAAVAAGLSLGLASLLGIAREATAAAVTDTGSALRGFVDQAGPTELAVAVAAGIATGAGPWASRRWRRVAWLVVLGLVTSRALVSPVSMSSLRALLVGWFAGAMSVVILGAPPRRPRGANLVAGLAAVGVPLRRIEQASLDARGSTPYFAQTSDGRHLFVKALGRDERSADLLFRLYRRVLPRDLGDERGYLSLRRAVEHEALLALAATGLGVRTPRFVALASAEPAAFVLAYEAIDGRSLDRLDPGDLDDEMLAGIWEQVGVLRHHRVAHRDLRLANIFLASDGTIWIIDFGFSELTASDTLLAGDLAELLASTSLHVGVQRSVSAAAAAVGPADLSTALERLHPWALSGATKTAMKERPGHLAMLRAAVELRTAAPLPE
jgi:undecaprenyl-diphosphatase